MDLQNDTVSRWFVLNSGFKVHGRCPLCHSPNLSYYKERHPGLKGISRRSQGISPVCIDCGHAQPKPKQEKSRKDQVAMKDQASKL